MLYACKDVHTLFTSQREREREREREKERERKRKRERERERERCRICPELLFLFLKGMTGAMAPFSCLVCNNSSNEMQLLPNLMLIDCKSSEGY